MAASLDPRNAAPALHRTLRWQDAFALAMAVSGLGDQRYSGWR